MKEQLRPPMDVNFKCKDAEHYMSRLIRSCETLQSLDSGNYPLTDYSSGEVCKRWVDKEGKTTREEFASLPILQRGIEKGLRTGITHVIFSDLNMCKEMGIGQEAKDIIEMYKRCK